MTTPRLPGLEPESDGPELDPVAAEFLSAWQETFGRTLTCGKDRLSSVKKLAALCQESGTTLTQAVKAYKPHATVKGKFYGADTFLRRSTRSRRVDDALGRSGAAAGKVLHFTKTDVEAQEHRAVDSRQRMLTFYRKTTPDTGNAELDVAIQARMLAENGQGPWPEGAGEAPTVEFMRELRKRMAPLAQAVDERRLLLQGRSEPAGAPQPVREPDGAPEAVRASQSPQADDPESWGQ